MAEDEIADSWEELEDSGELDRQIQNLSSQPTTTIRKENAKACGSGVVFEESDRSNYQPQVRILKRQPVSTAPTNSQPRNINQPTKTLAEREAAYAEARLRILGAAKHDDDGEETSNNMKRPLKLSQQFDNIKVTDNVIRQPKGPDGGRGFGSSASDPT